MPRNFLLLFNIVALVVLNLLFGEPVVVTQNLPDQIKPGDEFEVTVSIEKGSISSFAKVQIDLPEGMTAVATETQGASFTFNDQTIKFIWMTLPEDEKFDIKYKVTVSESISQQAYPVAGKFSYIEDNERRTYNIPNHSLTVTDQAVAADAEPEEFIAPEGFRTITDNGNGTYKVQITITKNSVTGFGKMQDFLPEGARAVGQNTEGASFTNVGNRAKFVWMNVPEDDEFTISYRITLGTASVAQLETVRGDFSYLENEQTKKAQIPTVEAEDVIADNTTTDDTTTDDTTADDTNTDDTSTDDTDDTTTDDTTADDTKTDDTSTDDTTADDTTTDDTSTDNTTADDTKTDDTTTDNTTADNTTTDDTTTDNTTDDTTADTNDDLQNQITNTPQPSVGVNYRVQICAGHRNVKENHFKTVYKYDETPVMTENHEGWIKYLIGSYNQYREARDRRNDVTDDYSFPGPFVTAYNDGDRITVQEALMISGQKWVK